MAAVAYTMADTAYERGYEDAVRDMEEREQRRKQLRAERQNRRRRRYIAFLKQKALGVLVLALSVAAPMLLDGDATICVLTVPMGLTLIFSKEYWLYDDYARELEERKRDKCRLENY